LSTDNSNDGAEPLELDILNLLVDLEKPTKSDNEDPIKTSFYLPPYGYFLVKRCKILTGCSFNTATNKILELGLPSLKCLKRFQINKVIVKLENLSDGADRLASLIKDPKKSSFVSMNPKKLQVRIVSWLHNAVAEVAGESAITFNDAIHYIFAVIVANDTSIITQPKWKPTSQQDISLMINHLSLLKMYYDNLLDQSATKPLSH